MARRRKVSLVLRPEENLAKARTALAGSKLREIRASRIRLCVRQASRAHTQTHIRVRTYYAGRSCTEGNALTLLLKWKSLFSCAHRREEKPKDATQSASLDADVASRRRGMRARSLNRPLRPSRCSFSSLIGKSNRSRLNSTERR